MNVLVIDQVLAVEFPEDHFKLVLLGARAELVGPAPNYKLTIPAAFNIRGCESGIRIVGEQKRTNSLFVGWKKKLCEKVVE